MRLISTLILLIFLKQVCATQTIQVFVSFSMPKNLLEETLRDCVRYKIPAYLNGLHHNSMPETVLQVMKLSKRIPGLNLQIDPVAFERFRITQVPALVITKDSAFDVIYGHLTLKEGLMRMVNRGEVKLKLHEVRSLLHE